jgi:hypothetical protein
MNPVRRRNGRLALAGYIQGFVLEPFEDLSDSFEANVLRAARRLTAACLLVVSAVGAWWVYVPVHELLHAVGCQLTGGTVTEVQIARLYGGALLARLFPFVVAGGDYAGRLSGFDTHGSDLVYLATDAAPYLLTVLIGVPLLKATARGGRPVRFGIALPIAFAPLYALPGDYYEIGSIALTRTLMWLGCGDPSTLAKLRSDDVIRLVTDLWLHPEAFQCHSSADLSGAIVVVCASFGSGALLALGTYASGAYVAHLGAGRSAGKPAIWQNSLGSTSP